jgi:lysine biosynthesis protein LysW
MASTYCPSCDAVIRKDNPRVGATLTCPECGEKLEVISSQPFEVDYPFEEEWQGWEEEEEEQ